MRFILALLLIASTAIGQSVSYPQSGSSSVATNVATNVSQYITNSTFDTGIQGWSPADVDVVWTNGRMYFSSVSQAHSANRVIYDLPQGDYYINTATVFRFVYEITNSANRTLYVYDLDTVECFSTSLVPNSAGIYTQEVRVPVCAQSNAFKIAFGSPDDLSGTYMDNATLSATNVSVSISTNVGSGSGLSVVSVAKGGHIVGVSR